MCVRYVGIDPRSNRVRERLGLFDPSDVPVVGESFPGDDGLILKMDEERGRVLTVARWGLQPGWAKDERFGKKNAYNARSETVAEKPTFRGPFRHRRCVIPSGGFYERAEGRWLRVSPAQGDLFLYAGLWEEPNEVTAGLPTFTMVTTEPNERIGEVHDRMPVVLAPEDAGAWMSPDAILDELRALLVPCPAEWTTVEDAGPVSRKKERPEEPGLF